MTDFLAEEMHQRLSRIRAHMAEEKVDALIATDAANVRYATGFRGEPRTLLITPEETVLYTSHRTLAWAQRQTQGLDIELSTEADPLAQILQRLPTTNTSAIGVDPSIPHRGMLAWQKKVAPRKLKISDVIAQARTIKSAAEIECMRHSQAHNEAVFQAILPKIRPGISERAAQGVILSEIAQRTELDGYAFPPIIAAGPNAWEIHHQPDDTELRAGDMVIIDLGVMHHGYASDMTRTICLGEPTDRMREIYDIVGEAQTQAIAAIRPGISNHQVDATAREIITEAGHARGFTHGLGHSIGIEVHDPAPALNASAPEISLAPGMAFTIEPGIYLENEFGIRTEDTIIVTKEGCQNLTTQSHTLEHL